MNAKRIFTGVMVGLTLVFAVAVAFSAEQLIEGTVNSIVTAMDKNGQPYTRVLTDFERSLSGTKYTVTLPVMGFGDQAEPAAKLTEGQKYKAIAQNRMFEGRESFTIIQILE